MKKFSKILMAGAMVIATLGMATGCCGNNDPQEPPESPTAASAFEVMAEATSKIDSTNLTLAQTLINSDVKSESVSLQSNIGLPILMRMQEDSQQNREIVGSFSEASMSNYIERLQFSSYVFYNVSYVLNSCKAENGYVTDFELGKTYYGVATNLPFATGNEMVDEYLHSENYKPILAATISQETDGISFVADWDFRDEFLAEYVKIVNFVIMVNGKIEYNYETNEVEKIYINVFQNELVGQFWSCLLDYTTDTFSYMEGYRSDVWSGITSKESITKAYNNGTLTYDKLCEYPYSGFIVAQGNIAPSIEDVDFEGYWKFADIENPDGEYSQVTVTEETYKNFYNAQYEKVKVLKLRDVEDLQDLNDAIQVEFMNDAVTYGKNKTTTVLVVENGKYTDIVLAYVEYEDLKQYISDMIETLAESDQAKVDMLTAALGYLDSINEDIYLGELGEYNGEETVFELVTQNGRPTSRENILNCDSFNYRISSDTTSIDFVITDGQVEILG